MDTVERFELVVSEEGILRFRSCRPILRDSVRFFYPPSPAVRSR